MHFTYPYGATPLNSDEIEGLIPQHIQIQKELNEWEQANILEAEFWLSNHHFDSLEILDVFFIKKIHLLDFVRG